MPSQIVQQPQGKENFSVPVVPPKIPGLILVGLRWVSCLSLNHSLQVLLLGRAGTVIRLVKTGPCLPHWKSE